MRNKKIPKGLRDILPDEVKAKRELEKRAADLFCSFGYQEVITPTIEYLEVVENGAGGNMRENLFLFMDREGGILSLRPEMTVSIARLAATHLQDEVLPLRLFYSANVFRHVEPQLAQHREFWQLGIELLGARGPQADAEVIGLAVKALEAFGLKDFKISMNDIRIINALVDNSALNQTEKMTIRRLIEKKDLVELERMLENMLIEDELKETIIKLPVLHGGLEVLEQLPYLQKQPQAAEAVEELKRVYHALQAYGVQDHIVIDMGVIRNFDYYTGLVFEGYSPDLGYGLLGGGRYDHLLDQFGFSCPATGFAIGMDRLALVLKHNFSEPNCYLIGGNDYASMVAKAEELRRQGYTVELDVLGWEQEKLEEMARAKENCRLIYLD